MQNAAEEPGAETIQHLMALFSAGHISEAETLARQMTVQYPAHGMGWKALGAALAQQAKWEEALPALISAATLLPGDAETHFNLGLACHQTQDWVNAESGYSKALLLNPQYPVAYNNLGLLYAAQGRHDAAIDAFNKAIAHGEGFAQAYNNLGLSLYQLERHEEAIPLFDQAIRLQSRYAEAYANMGAALHAMGALPEAEIMLRQSLALNSRYAGALNNLGRLLAETGRPDEAEQALLAALELNPGLPDAYNNLGNVYQIKKQYGEASTCYQQAANLRPDDPLTLNNLGTATQALGDFHQAIPYYQQALAVDPGYHSAHSNLLFALNYLSESSPEDNFRLARRYGESLSQARRFTQWNCEPNPQRLRVGMVSGDLLGHPVGYFLENVVKALNPDLVELFAYNTHHQEDALTQRIRPCFSQWESIFGMRDPAAAARIHADGIHVLLDLAGHTAFNRLGVFACKPAPVQASWLGYFATTGVREMDYLIADPWTLPVTEEPYFTEKIWRLPETRLCFTPPDTLVETSPLPAIANGYITFGCFNNLAKLNDGVIKTWAEILRAVPDSRLMLKAPQLTEPLTQEKTRQRFAQHGIDAGRLALEGPSSRAEYLEAYHRVDIALDPFPFTGGTTSAEALWMGIPVITLAGGRFISRQGVGLLENAGLHTWVAEDQASYIQKAVWHARAITELENLRHGLRRQVLDSPLFDAKRFAAHFEQALWGMWRDSTHRIAR